MCTALRCDIAVCHVCVRVCVSVCLCVHMLTGSAVTTESEQIRQEWMEVLDAAIEGVPEEAKERRATVSHRLTSVSQRINMNIILL